jgi:YaaC-like Protein
MAEFEWHQCRFLESSENLKPLVKRRFGREPSTSIAREIAACLQQGRLFYEAAGRSPLEIRPLQLFYGMVGFSKALVLASSGCSINTLRQSHGLKDISVNNPRIAELRVKLGNAGTFQNFNDVVAGLSRFCYIDIQSQRRAVYLPSAKSRELRGVQLSLREIISRIPGLESLYRMTFSEDAQTAYIGTSQQFPDERIFLVYFQEPELFTDITSLEQIVNRWRKKFPFLKLWRLDSATHRYGYSELVFRNSVVPENEFSPTNLQHHERSFVATNQGQEVSTPFPLERGLGPLAGGYPGPTYAISPVGGHHISEFSFHYLGLFLLSTLVRYRPQTWMHAVSRSALSETPVDDRMLSLIERFLDLNSGTVPEMIVTILNPHEDLFSRR